MFLLYCFLALATVFIFLKFKGKPRNGKRPPGPKGLPVFGNALEVNEENIIDKLFDFSDQYGEIFEIKLLHENLISLNTEGLVRKALASEPYKRYMNDRAKFFYAEQMLYGSQSIVFYGDAHSKVYSGMRKGMLKALHVYGQEGLNKFEESIQHELDRVNKKIELLDGNEIEVEALVKRSLTNIMSIVISGETIADDDKEVNVFWDYIDGINYFVSPSVNNILTFLPFLRFFPPFRHNYLRMCKGKKTIIERFYKNKKNKKFTDGSKCLVDSLLEEQRKSEEQGEEVIFTEERIICNILEIIGAGTLTTLALISGTFLCLINQPEYQDRIFEELEENIGRDRAPDHSDRANCPFLEAVELEVHRLMTIVPVLAGRICTRDLDLEGYDVPKGTLLIANIWRIHHDPEIWGDPWKFRPERYLDDEGQLLPRDHILRRNTIPFALGRRQCLGEQFAKTRFFQYMAVLLGRWKFVGVPGKFAPLDAKMRTNLDTNVTMRPKPFYCTAVKRY